MVARAEANLPEDQSRPDNGNSVSVQMAPKGEYLDLSGYEGYPPGIQVNAIVDLGAGGITQEPGIGAETSESIIAAGIKNKKIYTGENSVQKDAILLALATLERIAGEGPKAWLDPQNTTDYLTTDKHIIGAFQTHFFNKSNVRPVALGPNSALLLKNAGFSEASIVPATVTVMRRASEQKIIYGILYDETQLSGLANKSIFTKCHALDARIIMAFAYLLAYKKIYPFLFNVGATVATKQELATAMTLSKSLYPIDDRQNNGISTNFFVARIYPDNKNVLLRPAQSPDQELMFDLLINHLLDITLPPEERRLWPKDLVLTDVLKGKLCLYDDIFRDLTDNIPLIFANILAWRKMQVDELGTEKRFDVGQALTGVTYSN